VNTPNAQLDDGLFAFLTDSSNTGVVTTLRGGQAAATDPTVVRLACV